MTVEPYVIDANVLISAALSAQTPPGQVVRRVLAQGRILFSEATFRELETRLWRPKFDRYLTIESRKLLLHDFRLSAHGWTYHRGWALGAFVGMQMTTSSCTCPWQALPGC